MRIHYQCSHAGDDQLIIVHNNIVMWVCIELEHHKYNHYNHQHDLTIVIAHYSYTHITDDY